MPEQMKQVEFIQAMMEESAGPSSIFISARSQFHYCVLHHLEALVHAKCCTLKEKKIIITIFYNLHLFKLKLVFYKPLIVFYSKNNINVVYFTDLYILILLSIGSQIKQNK